MEKSSVLKMSGGDQGAGNSGRVYGKHSLHPILGQKTGIWKAYY